MPKDFTAIDNLLNFFMHYRNGIIGRGIKAAAMIPDFDHGTIRVRITDVAKPTFSFDLVQTVGEGRTRPADWRNNPDHEAVDTDGLSALKLANAEASKKPSEAINNRINGRVCGRGAFPVQFKYGGRDVSLIVAVSGATGEEDQFVALAIIVWLVSRIPDSYDLSNCLMKMDTKYLKLFKDIEKAFGENAVTHEYRNIHR
jgi:hypothetical protein